jgi:prevent-host-death family protein
MKTVNIQAAKTHLSRLVEEAVAGEEVILAKAGRPLVRLTPFVAQQQPRQLGLFRGRVVESSDCWQKDTALEDGFSSGPVLPDSKAPRRSPRKSL